MRDERNAWILFGLVVLFVGLINEVMFGYWILITEWAQGNWQIILFTLLVAPFIAIEIIKQYKLGKERQNINK